MLSTIYAAIPTTKISAVDAAIGQTIKEPITTVKLLAGGLSEAAVFCISTARAAYMLKIMPGSDANLLKYKLVAEAGIAPKCFYTDDANGILITEYVQNRPANSVFSAEQTVTALSRHISMLHKIVPPLNDKKADLTMIFDQTVNWFNEQEFLTGATKAQFLSGYARIREIYPWNDEATVLSHNDLNPRNVLCDGERLWVVDWDASSVGDRYVDLSIASNFFTPSPALEQLFLNTYFDGAPTSVQLARFKIIKPLCRLVYAMKFLQLALLNQPAEVAFNRDPNEIDLPTIGSLLKSGALSLATNEGLRLYGKAMLNEGLRQINDDGLQEQLACLS